MKQAINAPSTDTDRRQKVRDYIKESGISQAGFAKTIGVSESYVSRWIKGEMFETVDKKVDEFFAKQNDRKKINTQTPLPFACTEISKIVWNTLNYCRLQKFIGCIVGDAGIGKTRTIKEWAADKSDVYVVTATIATRNPKSFLKLLARKFGSVTTGTLDDIYYDLCRKIEGREITIVIDEAQHLKFDTLEQIRDLNDQHEATIVLVGNPKINKTLYGKRKDELEQLTSRIKMPQMLIKDCFSTNDLQMLFPELDEDAYQFLLNVVRHGAGLRDVMTIYINSLNNSDISIKGLKAMAKYMRISA